MNPTELSAYRQRLLARREVLRREVANLQSDLAALAAEPPRELEERAGSERARQLLDRLDAREEAELEAVEAALARLDSGDFGICTGCGDPIPTARLEALPWTPHCRDCAENAERAAAAGAEPEPPPQILPLPPDYALLSGSELEAVIREQLREDGRIDLDELRIVCRKGVVYLDGVLPSTAEHQILLHTITDVMGLPNVVDRVRVSGAPWEREDRSPEGPPAEEQKPWEAPPETEDIVEAAETGTDFTAPDRPLPDEE